MSNGWDLPSADDFIIPDEDVASQVPPKQTHQQAASGPSNQLTSQKPSGWKPKVDLSSAFTPFTSAKDFSNGNQIKERQYTGGDTLDEPIWQTLKRDLLRIGKRLAIVIWPMQLSKLAKKQQNRLIDFASGNGIQLPQQILDSRRISVSEYDEEDTAGMNLSESVNVGTLDWDLWGPLIFSLLFSATLGFASSNNQANLVFSGSFSFIWIFFIVVGLNIQLLGGNISFMSAISATGYSMFPIVIGELLCSLLLKWKIIRLAVIAILNTWSIYAAMMSLKCSGVLPGRVFLAMYPVGLMYSVLSWLVVIT
ncbi:uncharacterized protein PRCAT00004633001 [Priceomyces carsonii]|uniref:uncharacterized protein n=1 Tax=Priceomyces carsonii TaxID=28549 RepID=UPI002ED77779|nr:unnamed protein product [Priceomyces carsonii]